MEELLERLETKIKELIDHYHQLNKSHQDLHQGQFLLVNEKESLLDRQKQAITQIETLVSRLKTIEKSS
jgi:uncharacterized protein (TIGR02449 family)